METEVGEKEMARDWVVQELVIKNVEKDFGTI